MLTTVQQVPHWSQKTNGCQTHLQKDSLYRKTCICSSDTRTVDSVAFTGQSIN